MPEMVLEKFDCKCIFKPSRADFIVFYDVSLISVQKMLGRIVK